MARQSLATRLVTNGCDVTLESFQDELVELMAELCPNWSVDELVLHPADAMNFCTTARRKSGYSGIPDELILRCLMHRRKNPEA